MDAVTFDIIMFFVAPFVVAIGIFAIYMVIKEQARKKHLTCNKCKQVYDEDDIEWREVSRNTEHPTSGSEKIYANVEFVFTCHNCNTVKKFSKKFLIYSYYIQQSAGGSPKPVEKTYDLESLIEKFLDLKFREKYEAKQAKKAEKEMQKMENSANKKSEETENNND